MTASVVDARFAGGPIIVNAARAEDVRPALVNVDLPGLSVAMCADEARRLAVALIEQAARSEAPAEETWP